MARYNKRDWFQHFVKPASAAGKPCPHACCRNQRPHPESWPVHLPSRWLRSASDQQIFDWYGKHQDETPADAKARDQAIYELNRRDVAQERREASEERKRTRYSARRHERREAVEALWLAAEAGTKGNMLNRRGQEAGVNERTLFTGPESRARKYASEELLNWWEDHPRPTAAYFEGRDTRIGYANVGPRERITTEEQAWRDAYERVQYDFERAEAA